MNHETQRLLFAAGRGARVQYYEKAVPGLWLPGQWTDTNLLRVPNGKAFCERRIHPEDEHLQYGPISTELRRRADDDQHFELLPPYAWMTDTWVYYCAGTGTITYGKNGNYPWLCAFAAELAADEGM